MNLTPTTYGIAGFANRILEDAGQTQITSEDIVEACRQMYEPDVFEQARPALMDAAKSIVSRSHF